MPTNEADLVDAIRVSIVKAYPSAWFFKVVGHPYQMSGVPDLLVVIEGLLFGMEVKYRRPGESRMAAIARATPNQLIQLRKLRAAGAVAEVVMSVEEALSMIDTRLKRGSDG